MSLKPGDRFKFFFHPDGVIVLPIPISRLKGVVPKPAEPVSLDDIDAGIEAGATEIVILRHESPSEPEGEAKSFSEVLLFEIHELERRKDRRVKGEATT